MSAQQMQAFLASLTQLPADVNVGLVQRLASSGSTKTDVYTAICILQRKLVCFMGVRVCFVNSNQADSYIQG